MADELGKVERPSVEQFGAGRKLFYVPLLFAPREVEEDLQGKLDRYWEEVEAHVANLESKLGRVGRVFHELVPVGGEEGRKILEEVNERSHRICKKWLEAGAELQPVEEGAELAEYMDWTRCLAIGLQSAAAMSLVLDHYQASHKTRAEKMAERIRQTLKPGEIGVLLLREGHQLQYPADINVFYVSPPSLDEVHRWLRARAERTEGSGS